MWEQRVVGITSNPTIFAKAIRSGARYDAQVGAAASATRSCS
ncbi:hypothetical protein [Streptomyces sp. NPDC017964]